jgi:hypothetical protein
MQLLPNLNWPRAAMFFLSVAVSLSACNSASSVVTVRKSEPVIQKHAYDKNNRLPEEIEKHPSVEANTHWDFQCVPEVIVERKKLEPRSPGFAATVLVQNVSVDVKLPIDVWLPEGASERVAAHEEGHISICKHFYKYADTVANQCANEVLGHVFEGAGKDENEATQRAMEAASSALVACYHRKIIEPANRASAAYDRLTSHGQNSAPIDEAINKAIRESSEN